MLAMVLTAMITVRDANPWRWGAFSAQLLAGTTLIGGLSQFFHPKTGLLACGRYRAWADDPLPRAGDVRRTNAQLDGHGLHFLSRGKQARFRALIDTGNRLREPLSGLPVLIAEEKLLNGLDFSGVKFRNVAFGGLGGGGTLRCFRPEAVYLIQNGHKRRVSDVCVAIYEGIVPGCGTSACAAVVCGFARRTVGFQSKRSDDMKTICQNIFGLVVQIRRGAVCYIGRERSFACAADA